MIIVATYNAEAYIADGMALLRGGKTALDAVEKVIQGVESDTRDHSVGVGGYPNLVGEVELDASIMRGADRATGAVGAVRGFAHPISIARRVMEASPHVLLVGGGAEDFARECGFPEEETLTPEAAAAWAERLRANVALEEMPALLARRKLLPFTLMTRDPERTHGTVNVFAMDGRGRIASGVSTSGWAWKYPGRLGDSPLIGAGNYCDDRYGAAACTGHGELAIRGSLARCAVMHMQYGKPLEEACRETLADSPQPAAPEGSVLVLLAMDREGRHGSFTTSPKGWGYAYMDDAMEKPVRADSRVFARPE